MSRIDDGYEPDDTASFLRSCAFTHNIEQAQKGKKGLKFFKELEAALLALPEKKLISGAMAQVAGPPPDYYEVEARRKEWDYLGLGYIGPVLEPPGEVCALGAVALKRALDAKKKARRSKIVAELENDFPEDDTGWGLIQNAADHLGISMPLAYAIVDENDEGGAHHETPWQRYDRVLAWVRTKIASFTPAPDERRPPCPDR